MNINNTTLGVSVAAILMTAGVTLWWQHRRIRKPTKWREVGKISELVLYPLKSGKGSKVDEAECTKVGLKCGNLRDRFFVVYEEKNSNFVTGRKFPKMVLISTESRSSYIIFNAPEMSELAVNINELGKKITCTVWGDPVETFDCGDTAAIWMSTYLLQEKKGLRLGYYRRERPQRYLKKFSKAFPNYTWNDVGIYSDACSYHLVCESSVDDLNGRLEKEIVPGYFRPNFLVEGSAPFEEDSWDWIKIGNVVFRNVMPCPRCLFTTVDPVNGIKDPKQEPVETLKTYRQYTDPEARKVNGTSPAMGIYMGVYSAGSIKVGDTVFVGEVV